jgi:hypothetical protein
MDLGVMTVVVAVSFGAVGIVVGFLIGKSSHKGEDKKEVVEDRKVDEKISLLSSKIERLTEEVKTKFTEFSKASINELERKVNELYKELDSLQQELNGLQLSSGSIQAFEKAKQSLKSIKLSLPSIDQSLLTQIKDNLIIIRTDIQSLIQNKKETKEVRVDLTHLIDAINSAITLAREINARAVKDELIAFANSLQEKDKNELLKDLDKQALTSRELVLVLSTIRKELKGVKR